MARNVSVHKFRDLLEVQLFLDGGLLGGDASRGFDGLVGKALTFTQPAAVTVTFTTGSGPDPYHLSLLDVKAQLEDVVTGVAGLLVMQVNGRIALVESTPNSGVAFDTNVEPAKVLMGFCDPAIGATGRVIKKPGGAAPALLQAGWFDNMHVLYLVEV